MARTDERPAARATVGVTPHDHLWVKYICKRLAGAKAPVLPLRLVEYDEQHEALVLGEAVLCAGRHECPRTLLERKAHTLARQGSASLEDEIELVPLVRALLLRLG